MKYLLIILLICSCVCSQQANPLELNPLHYKDGKYYEILSDGREVPVGTDSLSTWMQNEGSSWETREILGMANSCQKFPKAWKQFSEWAFSGNSSKKSINEIPTIDMFVGALSQFLKSVHDISISIYHPTGMSGCYILRDKERNRISDKICGHGDGHTGSENTFRAAIIHGFAITEDRLNEHKMKIIASYETDYHPELQFFNENTTIKELKEWWKRRNKGQITQITISETDVSKHEFWCEFDDTKMTDIKALRRDFEDRFFVIGYGYCFVCDEYWWRENWGKPE